MKVFPAMLCAVFLLPASVVAQSTPSNGFTKNDVAQFLKLQPTVGHWVCKDTPASKKPDEVTTTREGSYYVSRETGDMPNTAYTRWSHLLQAYYTVTIYDQGGTTVYMTKSADPNNATWTGAFPDNSTLKTTARLMPFTVTLHGNTTTGTGQFYDAQGHLKTGTTVCTRS